MASIKRTLSAKTDKTGKAEIFLRLSISKNNKQRIKSGIFVTSSRFRDGEFIKPRANQKELHELNKIENELVELERYIISLCQKNELENLTKEFLLTSLDEYKHPEKYKKDGISFFDAFNKYIDDSSLSQVRLNNYRVLLRAIARFEEYKQKTNPRFKLTFDEFDENKLGEFMNFLKAEPAIYDRYPDLYEKIPSITRTQRKPKRPLPRGNNSIISIMKRLRAFFNWAIKKGYTKNCPFSQFTIGGEKYGTPYYITIEERDIIADYDLSTTHFLEIQRDIFIFQCLIGCRVSDLLSMTPASVINGAIEYMPQKTKGESPQVLRVPLNNRAKAIIEKYADRDNLNGKLLPFISSQKYNEAIKKIFTTCGITRIVTIQNPTTGEEEKRPINEIASSHLARRTFIGNLYKKVKDPNLVGSLSGHKEGSKAFARYRDIDDEMKKELINML